MSLPSKAPTLVARLRHALVIAHALIIALSLIALGPVSGRTTAHAQAPCTGEADGPPCPPPPTFGLQLQVPYETTQTTPMTVGFVVQGITFDYMGTMDVRVNGVVVM